MWTEMYCGEDQTMPKPEMMSYCKVFTDEMHSLYLLSLLLRNHGKAEQCFIAAVSEDVDNGEAPAEWIRHSARWSIVRHAIRMIRPVPDIAQSAASVSLRGSALSAQNNTFAGIFSLEAFERFVFVMSVLEGRSDGDCALLLRCSRREVTMARVLAIKRVANVDACFTPMNSAAQEKRMPMSESPMFEAGIILHAGCSGRQRPDRGLHPQLTEPRAR